ncbi:hypothetical protein [Sulfurimonas sp.]|uniref:hypothetical protein n=1 Tax=Sulfurimonas sp. TaxID=2022749 RepID=UPI002AB15556|nr:hypothetical protein [Sulfurimonas sp.]
MTKTQLCLYSVSQNYPIIRTSEAFQQCRDHFGTIVGGYIGSSIRTATNSLDYCTDGVSFSETILQEWQCNIICNDPLQTGYEFKNGTCEQIPVAPSPPECKPEDNQDLNTTTNSCDCIEGFARHNGICVTDTDGDGDPDITDPDDDDDGILDTADLDDDGDGILDTADPDHPDYSPVSFCQGMDLTTRVFFGTKFNILDYHPKGYKFPNTCSLYLSISTYDSAFEYSDLNPECTERKYCYVHYLKEDDKTKCSYSSSDVKPKGYVYISNLSEDECSAKVDMKKYIDKKYVFPNSLSCPGVAYCFLKPKVDLPPNSDSEDDDPTMNKQDLNTTSQDNRALLQASNTTNSHLKDLKDKTDLTNKSLERINETNTNLLASSKDINKNLSNVNSNLSSSLIQQKLMNNTLSNINKSIKASTLDTKGLKSIALNNNSQLQNIASNSRAMNENLQAGLFGDNPFSGVDFTDDGSSKFSGFQGDVSSAFDITTYTNIFGLSGLSGGAIPEYSAYIMGHKIIVFEPSMLNGFPLTEIKALIMFIFALMGFIHTFRSV